MTLRLASLLLALVLVAGCTETATDAPVATPVATADYTPYGESVALEDGTPILTPSALLANPAAYDGETVRVEGTIAEMCRMKGCWLTLRDADAEAGETVRVRVPTDSSGTYVYTFPTDLGMIDAVVEGTVNVDTMSVDELRHYAEDEGRPQEEIEAITEPQPTVVLTAHGALVEKADAAETDVPEPDAAEPEAEPVAEPAAQS